MALQQSALGFLAEQAVQETVTGLDRAPLDALDHNVPVVIQEARSIDVQVGSWCANALSLVW